MKNLAPNIVRQRLLIEGFYKIKVDKGVIRKYFEQLTKALGLRIYRKPIIFSPSGTGRKENQGYDAFAPLIDSGIALYVWTNAKFLSAVMYTCKKFDEERAIKMTKKFFKISKAAKQAF